MYFYYYRNKSYKSRGHFIRYLMKCNPVATGIAEDSKGFYWTYNDQMLLIQGATKKYARGW